MERKNTPTRYTYKDFITGKLKHTHGRFERWGQGGILNAWGALFILRSSTLWVPHYCLSIESKAALPAVPHEEAS